MKIFERFEGTASAVGLLLIWAFVTWLGIAGPIWKAYWTATPEQWLSFSGSALGGSMTLLAAILAWCAVGRQIVENRKIATLSSDRAEIAIAEELMPLLQALNVLWTMIDDTLALHSAKRWYRLDWLQSTVWSIPPQTIIDDLERYAQSLTVDRRRLFSRVTLYLRTTYRVATRMAERVPLNSAERDQRALANDLKFMRDQLVRVLASATSFSPEFAKALPSRTTDDDGQDFDYARMLTSEFEMLKMEESYEEQPEIDEITSPPERL